MPSRTLEVMIPGEYLSSNDRRHRQEDAVLTRLWKDAAYWAACQERPTPSARRIPAKATVQLILPFGTRQRRDPHNYYPTVKAVIDGLTGANLWPDDNAQFVETKEPVLWIAEEPSKHWRVHVHITWSADSSQPG